MKFISSTKTSKYELCDELIGEITIKKRDCSVMLEASIHNSSEQTDGEVIVFKGYLNDYNAAPLFGRAYEILRDEKLCKKFWNEHMQRIREEKEND